MKATGLPARTLYAAAALPAGLVAGFFATDWLLPVAAPWFGGASPLPRSQDLFRLALSVGALVAIPAMLCALTLPWRRRRQRRGRRWRLAASSVMVVTSSLTFAGFDHSLLQDLLFAVYLSYALALTYVRYGVTDEARRITYATTPDDD